jgi:TetR/AcrR family transcriptional repressor of nem operon
MKSLSELTPSATRIVDAAEGLIQAVGYNGFSYDDVAQVVGIRKPSIHHHFPTKAELGAVVVQRYTQRFMNMLAEIVQLELTLSGRLRSYARLFETTYAKDRRLCLCGMLGAESDGLPPNVNQEVRDFFGKNLAWLKSVLQDGVKKGEIEPRCSVEVLAKLVLAALEGGMLLGRGQESKRGLQQVIEALFSAIGK